MTNERRISVAGIVGMALSAVALGQSADEKQAAGAKPGGVEGIPPEMQACIEAGTPGKEHEFLTAQAGTWSGESQMWMGPAATEPMKSTCTWTVTPVMNGRYIRCELAGEMPGMGTFAGLGHFGFDNVSQKFVGSWLDDHSTGIMHAVGELSSDRKQIEWKFNYNCPMTKKPAVVRELHRYTGADTMEIESFVNDPASGKEYRCIQIVLTRKR